LASSFEARSEANSLRALLVHGTRVSLLLFWPIGITLFIRGPRFIGLWMGPEYAVVSGTVLRILLIATFVQSANHASANIVFGMGKHRSVALWQIGEAAANLLLSVILVRRVGLYGVAWGTVIPELVVNLLLWPRYITRLLDIGLRRFLVDAWLRPLCAVIPYVFVCAYVERFFIPRGILAFVLQTLFLYPVFLIGAALCFRSEVWNVVLKIRVRLTHRQCHESYVTEGQ